MLNHVIGAVVLMGVLLAGFSMGKSSVVDHCDIIGKFQRAGVVYICTPEKP